MLIDALCCFPTWTMPFLHFAIVILMIIAFPVERNKALLRSKHVSPQRFRSSCIMHHEPSLSLRPMAVRNSPNPPCVVRKLDRGGTSVASDRSTLSYTPLVLYDGDSGGPSGGEKELGAVTIAEIHLTQLPSKGISVSNNSYPILVRCCLWFCVFSLSSPTDFEVCVAVGQT